MYNAYCKTCCYQRLRASNNKFKQNPTTKRIKKNKSEQSMQLGSLKVVEWLQLLKCTSKGVIF